MSTEIQIDFNDPVDKYLIDTVRAGSPAEVRRAFQEHPDRLHVGWRNGSRSWPLIAVEGGRLDNLKALVELGGDIDQGKDYAPDENALNCAVGEGLVDILRYLLERGAATTKPRLIIRAVNADKNEIQVIQLLEQAGVDLHQIFINEMTGRKMNALSTAHDYGKFAVAEYLKSRGCVLPPEPEEEIVAAEVVPSLSEQVIAHFEQTVGPVEKISLIEIVPTGVPISIHAVPPAEGRPLVTLFTSGLSEYPMKVPEGHEPFARAELYIQLPADWKYREFANPEWGWPQYWLRSMAQYPAQHDSWLGGPVTLVANQEPPQPLAPHTQFTTMLMIVDRSFQSREGQTVSLYRLMPLYTEERELELREGAAALMRTLDANNVPFVVDMHRKNVGL